MSYDEHTATKVLPMLAARLVLEKYCSCVDRRDWQGLGECFAEDAHAVYNSGARRDLFGRAAIVERLRIVTRFLATNHLLSNTNIVVTGVQAKATTNAIAHLVIGETEASRILIRGVRYDDELQLADGQWQIKRRMHEPLWQYEANAVALGY